MKWKYKREIIRETTRKSDAKTERGKRNGAEGIIKKKRLKRTKGQNEIGEKKKEKIAANEERVHKQRCINVDSQS